MNEIIYSSRAEALNACKQYRNAILELQEKFGTWETCDDSCCMGYVHAKYRDENGNVQKVCEC
jgi:hypothetical protein